MLDLSGYDLVISSDSGPVKGVVIDLDATHIFYCHSPMRYLWDGYSACRREMPPLAQTFFGLASHYVRNWDYLPPLKAWTRFWVICFGKSLWQSLSKLLKGDRSLDWGGRVKGHLLALKDIFLGRCHPRRIKEM